MRDRSPATLRAKNPTNEQDMDHALDINDDAFHQPPSLCQRASHFANRLFHSTGYSGFYIFMILINLVLIVWIITAHHHYPTHWMFIALEVFVNAALLGEVGLKLFAQGKVSITIFRLYLLKYYHPLTTSLEIFHFLVQPFWCRDLVIMCCIFASLFSRAIFFRRNWGSCEHIPLDVPICPPILTINYAYQKVPVPSTVIAKTHYFLSHQQKLTNTNNNRIDFSSLDLEIEEQSSAPNRSPPTPVRHESWGKEDYYNPLQMKVLYLCMYEMGTTWV